MTRSSTPGAIAAHQLLATAGHGDQLRSVQSPPSGSIRRQHVIGQGQLVSLEVRCLKVEQWRDLQIALLRIQADQADSTTVLEVEHPPPAPSPAQDLTWLEMQGRCCRPAFAHLSVPPHPPMLSRPAASVAFGALEVVAETPPTTHQATSEDEMDGRGAEALFRAIASLGEQEQRLVRTVTDLDSDQRLLLGDSVAGADPEVRRLCHHLLERWDDLAVADRVASLVMLTELLAAGRD